MLPDLGAHRLSDINRADLQKFAERMQVEGLKASTIRNAMTPLRAIFGRACFLNELAINPTTGLRLPVVRGSNDRIVDPATATVLLAALPASDRALWACALFAGLRHRELLALRWEDVDLAGGVIRVERSYDPRTKATGEPKSKAGRRKVPIAPVPRDHLTEHKMRSAWTDGLVFGITAREPFDDSTVRTRATGAWRTAAVDRARQDGADAATLEQVGRDFTVPLRMHEARHTFASWMIAAGVNAKALSTYMGHSSIKTTMDLYGHMMPAARTRRPACSTPTWRAPIRAHDSSNYHEPKPRENTDELHQRSVQGGAVERDGQGDHER